MKTAVAASIRAAVTFSMSRATVRIAQGKSGVTSVGESLIQTMFRPHNMNAAPASVRPIREMPYRRARNQTPAPAIQRRRIALRVQDHVGGKYMCRRMVG